MDRVCLATRNACPYSHRYLHFTPVQSNVAALCHVGLKGRVMGHEGPSLGCQGQQTDGCRRDIGSCPLSGCLERGRWLILFSSPQLPQSKCITVVPIFPTKKSRPRRVRELASQCLSVLRPVCPAHPPPVVPPPGKIDCDENHCPISGIPPRQKAWAPQTLGGHGQFTVQNWAVGLSEDIWQP